jgi:4-amino-4-deoxy-L-arabinose transferase-like glycosyltransferase
MYSHDQDLLSWFVKDIVTNHNLRLIGQETSVHGVFIGPLWYYLAVPFYVLFGMNPTGGLVLSIITGGLTVASIYYVFTSVSKRSVGLLGALLYAVSFYSVMTDREVVPTTPTILWSVWAFFALHLFLQKRYRPALVLTGVLAGLIWHINMGLVLIIPIIGIAYLVSLVRHKQKGEHIVLYGKSMVLAAVAAALILSPYLLFEVRHSFVQTKSILTSSSTAATQSFMEKLDRTTSLASKNIIGFTWGPYLSLPDKYPLFLMVILLVSLVYLKKMDKTLGGFALFWLGLFLAFFSYNSLNLSEYYLNGMLVIEVFILATLLATLIESKQLRSLGAVLLTLFVVSNMIRLFTLPVNKSGYVDRNALVQFIKEDAAKHGYPCVSVSYITEPGFNLGYRYLYYINGLRVNQPSSLAPVYTVVFPHSRVDRIDKSFGALGLIYPDYNRYKPEQILVSCSGPDANVTDSLFGYVQ